MPTYLVIPIQTAVGVSVNHLYLIILLHRLDMPCSYDEVHRFKQSVAWCKSEESH